MHIDARSLEDGTLIEGDICIIGAGAAGISLALEWNDTRHKVILLEGGGFDVEYEMQDLYTGESVGQPYFPLQSARLHYFGGTTGHWGGWSSPFDVQDFEKRDWVPHSGWPITRADLDPFYKRACRYLELGKDTFEIEDYIREDSELVKLPFDESAVRTKMWQMSPPTRFGKVYRDPIVNSDNIHLYTYANVCDISANNEVSAVEEVVIRSRDGKTHTVRAQHFVLACGAIQNARMLLASNHQAPNGLGNDNDLVGRYFMEHLEVISARMIFREPLPIKLYTYQFGISRHFGELTLTAAKQKQLRVLNGTTALRAQASSNAGRGVAGFSADAAANVRQREERLEAIRSGKTVPADNSQRVEYTMQVRMEQAPNPDSRILLSDEKDALGVPRTKLDWRLSALEKRSIRQLHEVLGVEAGRQDVGRIQLSDWLLTDEPMWPTGLAGGWHHMGTTRMHDNPQEGVVDRQCKVHGIANLHIAGSAVFPTAGAANPTLTLIAMTLRLSDRLKSLMG